MRRILFFSIFLLMTVSQEAFAQFVRVSGIVVDKESGIPLIAATVRFNTNGDEILGITNDKGLFSMELPRPGSYKLEISYVGFQNLFRDIQCRPGDNNIGKLRLSEDAVVLKNTQVLGKNMRVRQNADTTVYNADGYKVLAGATGEDLIAKMPGMVIRDGKIEAQGEEVKKVMVDGKPFFENDPQLALKTLPAEVIQSVAVFDKKSEQAEFTGFDDGNTVKALDVRTRSFKRNGVFGKVYAQYGTDNHYNVGGNVNYFKGERRVTLLGLFNDVNQQDFSIDDILGTMSSGKRLSGGGGPGMPPPGSNGPGEFNRATSQNGVTRANAVGLNYSDQWGEKLEVNASYFFNMTHNTLQDSLNRNYFDTIGGKRIYDEVSNAVTDNYSNRFNMRMNYRPSEKDEILFMPRLSFQNNQSETDSESRMLLDGDVQSQSHTEKKSGANGYDLSADLLWRHKFEKEGRTLSAMFKGGMNKNDSHSDQVITMSEDVTKQKVLHYANSYNYGGNVMFTEPIVENQQLSASYQISITNSDSDKKTEQYEEADFYINPSLSNRYKNDYLTQSIGLGYRLNHRKIRLMTNLNLQQASLDGDQEYPYSEQIAAHTSKNYYSVLPMGMLDYMPADNMSVRLMYRSASTSPSVTQLQQTLDNSSPLQLYIGNPELNQTIEHDLSVRFIKSNIEKATNWMAHLSVSKKRDYIGSDVKVLSEDQVIGDVTVQKGAQLATPVNLDGYVKLASNLSFGFPVDFLLSNLNVSTGVNYSHIPGIYEGLYSKTKSLSIVPGAVLTSNISEDLDFTVSYDADFNKVQNNMLASGNYDYLTHNAKAKLGWVIWKGIFIESNLNWKCYAGSSMEEKEEQWILNASFGKKFLKNNQAEVKLVGYDLLKQNRAFSRTVGDTYIQNSYTNVLGRYFMMTFTYNLQYFNAKSAVKSAAMS